MMVAFFAYVNIFSIHYFSNFFKGHPELENLRSNYLQYLSTSGQEEKAGEV